MASPSGPNLKVSTSWGLWKAVRVPYTFRNSKIIPASSFKEQPGLEKEGSGFRSRPVSKIRKIGF